MILSDRDLRALIENGSLVIEPFDPDSVQPSSIDLRVGNQFRVFANSRYPFIDVRQPMDGLTEIVEASDDEPFILHPGEFVLGSTLERVALPNDKVGRLEGKSSLGRLGLLIHSSLPEDEPVLFRDENGGTSWRPIDEIVRKSLNGDVVAFDPNSFEVSYAAVTGWYEGPPDRIFEVVLASGRSVRVTAGHNLFTLDSEGQLIKVRTGELHPGTFVALPRRIPDSESSAPEIDLAALADERALQRLVFEGDAIEELFRDKYPEIAQSLKTAGIGHADYYRSKSRLPAAVQRLGYTHPTDLCNIEQRSGRDAVRLRTLRRFVDGYEDHAEDSSAFFRLRRLTEGDLVWDRVVEVRDTGEQRAIFDLEVRPDGRRIENFLAGRGGVFVANTAGFVDAGFDGYLTLELSNVANLPITLYPGMKIGQLCLFEMSSPAERPYGSRELGSKYHGQVGPTPSRYFENFEESDT
jgi:deoxycytidine triphosphate deaminase